MGQHEPKKKPARLTWLSGEEVAVSSQFTGLVIGNNSLPATSLTGTVIVEMLVVSWR